MALVRVNNVSIEFPVYDAHALSLRNHLLRMGNKGRFALNAGRVLTVKALRNISLEILDGDRIGLLGPNGAGKSTLLRAITGIYEPTQGEIEISGKVANLIEMGLGIDPELTGRENVLLRALFLGMTRGEIYGKLPEIESFVELGESFDLPVRTYSTGMVMRLALGVSTSVDPEILLIDEGIAAGDQHFMKKAKARVEQIMGSTRIMVLASHDLDLLSRTCSKGVLLAEGQIQMVGPIEDVISAYRGSC